MMHTYSNPATQAYVNALHADIDAREARLVSLRRAGMQNKPYKRLAWSTSKIADLSPDEQSKIIRLNKES